MNTLGVYAGSFDPITNGHLSSIEQALGLVDRLIIAIGVNPGKTGFFTPDYRHSLINDSLREYFDDNGTVLKRINVMYTGNDLLVRFAEKQGATHLFRGLRNAQDYAYESEAEAFNRKLAPEIQTVYLPTDPKYAGTSSSFIRGLVGFNGWINEISHLVPGPVMRALIQHNDKEKRVAS